MLDESARQTKRSILVTNDRFGRDCIVERAFDSLDKAIKFSKSDNLDNRHLAYDIKKMRVE